MSPPKTTGEEPSSDPGRAGQVSEGGSGLGKYRLIAELGRGAKADVYLVAAAGPGGFTKLLVIKHLRLGDDPALVAMFLDEARLTARLNHPNVVQTFEVFHEDTCAFMVMEFLDGPALSRLRREGAQAQEAVPLKIQLRILRDALAGLHHAHELKGYNGDSLNVVHRDFTPQNIIITYSGDVKIVDFGIAKALDQQVTTSVGIFKGRLSYAPPEQLLARAIDRRCDVFTAGVMLFEAITGASPWEGLSNTAINQALAAGRIPRLTKQSAPPQLVAICHRAMAVDPASRFASANELRLALEAFVIEAQLEVEREALGAYVAGLLGETREHTRRVIGQQMQRALALPSGDTLARKLPTLELPTPAPSSQGPTPDLPAVLDSTTKPEDLYSSEGEPQRHQGLSMMGKILIGLLSIVLLGLCGVVGWLVLRTHSPPTVAVAPAVPVVPPAPVPAPAPTPAPTPEPTREPAPPALAAAVAPKPPPEPTPTVQVKIRASPSNARLFLDSLDLRTNPYSGTVARDADLHHLVVSAPGYEVLRRAVQLDRDLWLDLNLTRTPVRAREERPRPPPPKSAPPPPAAPPKALEPEESEYFPKSTPKKPKRPIDTNIEF